MAESILDSVLVVGGGGREHSLVETIAASPDVGTVYCAPGNPGTAMLEKVQNQPFGPKDLDEIVEFARGRGDKFTVVVGPEAPLVAGLGDRLREAGVAVFGPNAEAAQLESSKIFAAEFNDQYSIPQPQSTIVRNIEEALAAIDGRDPTSYVLKADGLAGGKGVVLPDSREQAEQVLRDMLSGDGYDGAGKTGVVIQERLHGPELSVFVVFDGNKSLILPVAARDYKRLRDGDEAPNTGGMGAIAIPIDKALTERQQTKFRESLQKFENGLKHRKLHDVGVVYVSLMLVEEWDGDPAVIEYNRRFGDPEQQVVGRVLAAMGIDLHDIMRGAARGRMPELRVARPAGRSALTVCMAAPGYPSKPQTGAVIHGLDRKYPNVTVYHGGTKARGDGSLEVSGGRVVYVTGEGETDEDAAEAAYAAIGRQAIYFEGEQHRDDIGPGNPNKRQSV